MIMQNTHSHLNGKEITVDLKSSLDHSDFDMQFYMGRMKNDAAVLGEIASLRKARQELKEFEADTESHLPSHYKLKEFRKLAKDVIEGGIDRKSRGPRRGNRTEFEEDKLAIKMTEFQKKYPHVDIT